MTRTAAKILYTAGRKIRVKVTTETGVKTEIISKYDPIPHTGTDYRNETSFVDNLKSISNGVKAAYTFSF